MKSGIFRQNCEKTFPLIISTRTTHLSSNLLQIDCPMSLTLYVKHNVIILTNKQIWLWLILYEIWHFSFTTKKSRPSASWLIAKWKKPCPHRDKEQVLVVIKSWETKGWCWELYDNQRRWERSSLWQHTMHMPIPNVLFLWPLKHDRRVNKTRIWQYRAFQQKRHTAIKSRFYAWKVRIICLFLYLQYC